MQIHLITSNFLTDLLSSSVQSKMTSFIMSISSNNMAPKSQSLPQTTEPKRTKYKKIRLNKQHDSECPFADSLEFLGRHSKDIESIWTGSSDVSTLDVDVATAHVDCPKIKAYISNRASSKEIKDMQDENIHGVMTIRCRYASSRVTHIFTTNVVPDEMLLNVYRRLCQSCRPHQRMEEDWKVADDGGLVLVKLIKFLLWTVLGIVMVHQLVRWMVGCYYLNRLLAFFDSLLVSLLFFTSNFS